MDVLKKLFKVVFVKEKGAFYIKLEENESWDNFRKEIKKRKPELEEKDYRVFWIDADNDEIIISCDDDFKICVEDETIKKIFVETYMNNPERKRHQEPPKDLGKKLKTNYIELEDSETSSISSDSSDEYTFKPKQIPRSANKSTETVISSTSDSPRKSTDHGINIINIEVVREANKVDETTQLTSLEEQISTPTVSEVINDDVMLVDDEEAPLAASSAKAVAEPSNLVNLSDSDSEGFVETISITRKNKSKPRCGRYNFSSQSIPDNIYNARHGPNRNGFDDDSSGNPYSHHHHRQHSPHDGFNGAYSRSSFFQNGPHRRFSAHAGRMPEFQRFRAQQHAQNLFDGVQTMVSNISSTVNDNLRRSFGNAFPYNPRNA